MSRRFLALFQQLLLIDIEQAKREKGSATEKLKMKMVRYLREEWIGMQLFFGTSSSVVSVGFRRDRLLFCSELFAACIHFTRST